ncbi:MAG: SUMF1/EgtB/PvdO family nonheme iron enzyme [Thiothrix sp.]
MSLLIRAAMSVDIEVEREREAVMGSCTSPVGSFAANGYGLYMNGTFGSVMASMPQLETKVRRWMVGAWKSSDDRASRVLRGGSWYNAPRSVRSANRNGLTPDDRGSSIGFRLASG